MNVDTTYFLYGLLSGMLPPLLWLWFWLKENHLHPEPRGKIAACFFFGMVAVLCAFPLQALVRDLFAGDRTHYILWAFIEEILKFSAVYVVVFFRKKMDEPIDALVYMITAALGFAALENTFFMLQVIPSNDIASAIITGNLRFVGAILLHVVCSATVGFMLAITFYHGKKLKAIAAIVGIAIAGTLHASFNLAIIHSTGFNTLGVFGWVWGGAVLLVILFEEIKVIKPPAENKIAAHG